jgi:hypothetical protein
MTEKNGSGEEKAKDIQYFGTTDILAPMLCAE